MLFGFFFQISVVKILVPSEFAIYAVAFAAVMIASQLLSFGVPETLVRFVPLHMAKKDVGGLIGLARRMLALRTASFLVLFVLLIIGSQFSALSISSLSLADLLIITVWLVATILYADVFDLAQSLMAQREAAVVTTSETAMRFAALFALFLLGRHIDARSVISIYATTVTLSLICLSYLVGRYFTGLSGLTRADPVGNVFHFVLGRSVSAAIGVISSPSMVRVVAATGLDALALSAFSFVQGLYASVQRAFPGFLLVQSIEPILLSRLAHGVDYEKILSSVAVAFKLEIFFASSVFIASALAGPTLITLLARSEYSQYWYVLLFLGVNTLITVAYRILEVVSSATAKQAIFLWVWPLAVLSLACIYFTLPIWGIWATLIFPLLEGLLRVSLLVLFLRRDGVQIALDAGRSTLMIVSAAIIVGIASYFVGPSESSSIRDLLLASTSILVFGVVVCAERPLRPMENQLIMKAVPRGWKAVRFFANAITRP